MIRPTGRMQGLAQDRDYPRPRGRRYTLCALHLDHAMHFRPRVAAPIQNAEPCATECKGNGEGTLLGLHNHLQRIWQLRIVGFAGTNFATSQRGWQVLVVNETAERRQVICVVAKSPLLLVLRQVKGNWSHRWNRCVSFIRVGRAQRRRAFRQLSGSGRCLGIRA